VIISLINMSNGAVSDASLQYAIRAVNRQIAEDFAPYWGFGAHVRLEGKTGRKRADVDPADMRGDAILYLRKTTDLSDAEGYHDRHFSGIPYGFVFLDLSTALGEDWSVTLSHEALELTADPEANLLVRGPHPVERKRSVFHWFELCDAVQEETYKIDSVSVSNFVLPLYYTSSNERGGRNDFLGTTGPDGKSLRSFSVNPGGYIGFFDPKKQDDETWSLDDDPRGKQRLRIKLDLRVGRGQRRRRPDAGTQPEPVTNP
jgi:hypothetical protein